jgi:hypothetical protein
MSLTFDTNIKVGDLITAYEKGFHRVTGLSEHAQYGTMVEYKRVLSDKGTISKGSIRTCNGSYCKKMDVIAVEEYLKKAFADYKLLRDNLTYEASKK